MLYIFLPHQAYYRKVKDILFIRQYFANHLAFWIVLGYLIF